MKKLIFLLVMSLPLGVHAQKNVSPFIPVEERRIEAMMYKRVLSCNDIYFNSISLIPQLYRGGQKDTAEAVRYYWEKYCGLNESNVAFDILYMIQLGTFTEVLTAPGDKSTDGGTAGRSNYEANIISYLTEYCRVYGTEQLTNYRYLYREAGEQYKAFIKEMAVSLMKKDLKPVERFLVEFYADPDLERLKKLSAPAYAGTALQRSYTRQNTFGGLYMGLGTGVWHPTGKLSFLGDHPIISIHAGGRGKRFYVDYSAQFRILNSPNRFQTVYQGSLVSSKHHIGVFLGGDAGYALLKGRTHELDVQGGIGYDGIEVVANTSTNNNGDNSKTLGSLNLGAGLGYRIYIRHRVDADNNNHTFLQLLARYNAVSYRNRGGTDFTGNAITFGLIFGGYLSAPHKYYERN